MSDSGNRIQNRMRQIRGQLDDDFGTAVDSAKDMFDWREYVRKYPWVCLGGAVAIGYLAVPRKLEIRQPDVDTLLKLAERNKLVVTANPSAQKQKGWANMLASFVANAAMRGALAYAGHQLGKMSAHPSAEPENAS